VGLKWGPLSHVSTIEELLEKKSSGCSIESREYGRRDVTGSIVRFARRLRLRSLVFLMFLSSPPGHFHHGIFTFDSLAYSIF
jgi:hypothetical protein